MIKKPFFGWGGPVLRYPVIKRDEKESIREIPLPQRASILLDLPFSAFDNNLLKPGDNVKTGQRIVLSKEGGEYFISTVTGTVANISEYIGYTGRNYTSILIEDVREDRWDNWFKNVSDRDLIGNSIRFLRSLPGKPDFGELISPNNPPNTIVINAIDEDLLVKINQLSVVNDPEDLAKGVVYLKKIVNAGRIVIIVPPELAFDAEKSGAEVRVIKPVYPNALPKIVMEKVLNSVVPVGKTCEDMGVAFINAEAVIALARAFGKGEMPINKSVTFIGKDGETVNLKVRIGTTVKAILNHLNIITTHGDRLVMGGPMRGKSIYTEDMPVSYDTDAIIIQDRDHISINADIHCVNCGECVRACPAKIPVNMLIRFLENSLYEEAVQEYDLLSCVECGICSYVCVARIPVFHYIMLGKYEYERLKHREALNV
jgi:H+/Na+-translocating ferredoxin:NAD+ oxidoreductase subunit C